MVGDDIIKTRCTTCDAEHPYKHARVPARRRKKEEPKALFKEVLEGVTEQPPTIPPPAESSPDQVTALADSVDAADTQPVAERVADSVVVAAALSPAGDGSNGPAESADAVAPEEAADEGPHHRVTLIRATLPRPEGQSATRQPPEFTMHRMRNGPSKHGRRRVRGGAKGGGWSGEPKSGGKGAFNAGPPRGASRPGRDNRRSSGPRRPR